MSYRDEVLTDAPLLYYPMDDLVAFTCADASGSGLDGKFIGTEFCGPFVAGSRFAREFDGTPNTYIDRAGATALRIYGDLTIELWAYLTAYPVSAGCYFLCYTMNGESSDTNILFSLRLYIDGSIGYLHEYNSGVDQGGYSDAVIPLNTPCHIALVRNSTSKICEFFINGVSSATMAYTANPTGGTNSAMRLRIPGANQTPTTYSELFGKMAHVAIYNKKLSAARVMAHYLAGVQPVVTGTVTIGSPPTPAERRVLILATSTESVVGAANSDAGDGGYSATCEESGVVYGLNYVDYGEPWIKSHVYALDDRTWHGAPAPLGHWYECEQAGTTGSTEPTWPTDGSTVTDGTVIWRDKGVMERPWAEGPYLAEAV